MNRFLRATYQIVALFSCSLALSANTEVSDPSQSNSPEPQNKVYFSLADDSSAPKRESIEEFDCTDKIYAVAELQGYSLGKHEFSVRWVGPAGEQRELTQYPFHVHNNDEHRLWAWLLLSRARGAGMLTFINPAAGLEEFIGEWKVEVKIDQKLISSSGFIVSC